MCERQCLAVLALYLRLAGGGAGLQRKGLAGGGRAEGRGELGGRREDQLLARLLQLEGGGQSQP